MRPSDKDLIDALRTGEAACLIALALEPISANHSRWERAATKIREEREMLERGFSFDHEKRT